MEAWLVVVLVVGVFEYGGVAQQEYVGRVGVDKVFVGYAFGFAAYVPVA